MPYSKSEAIVFLVLMMVFIFAMVIFIIIILFYAQKKQRKFKNELTDVNTKHDHELSNTQLEVREQILQDFSRDIHDNVGQILSLAKLGLGTLDVEKKNEAKENISEISDILDRALDILRNMSRSMNGELIKKGGLRKSIEMQVGYIQRSGKFNIRLDVSGDPAMLHEKKEIVLFRIVQEAINNIIRHSCATHICISLCYDKNSLELQVCDNGKGFVLTEKISRPNHLNGIYNMQHRAKMIGSDFKIDSKVDSGTRIIVTTSF